MGGGREAKLCEDYEEFLEDIVILEVSETRDFDVKSCKIKVAEKKAGEAVKKEEKDARAQLKKLKERFGE